MKVEFGRLVDVVADEEWSKAHERGGASFCRLLFFNDTFYVFVLSGRSYYVRGFDTDWKFTGFEKKLTSEGDVDVDQDITFDGEYIYEYIDLNGPKGRVRKFDKEFNLVKCSAMLRGESDVILDQNLTIIKDKIYAGSEYREKRNIWNQPRQPGMQNMPPNPLVARGSHLRILDKDLNLLQEKDLIANVTGAVVPNQYWGLGVSQLYADGYYCGVVHSPIGNVSQFDHGESLGARQIFILRFDDDFNFVDSKGPLSDTNYDNFWCTGSWYEDNLFFISYVCRKKGCVMGPRVPREPGEGSLRLGIFDKDFNELETIEVNSTGGGLTKILKIGNKLYVTSASRGAFVQELILKTI